MFDRAAIPARDRLILALDFSSPADARALIEQLGASVGFYKIGLEMIYAGGLDLARDLARDGKQVFLDAKLLDIGNTVERATATIAGLGMTLLTVHGHDRKTLDAAVRGRAGSDLKLVANAVMTNLNQADLTQQGIEMPAMQLALHRARLARDAGFDGVVPSAQEAREIRELFGDELLIVTPGIRPAGADIGDQARVMTPSRAIAAGADYLVIGRPITQAADPVGAAEAIVAEIAGALRAS